MPCVCVLIILMVLTLLLLLFGCCDSQYIFQQVVNGHDIEHHLWMLQPASTTYKVQDLTRGQAEALRQRFRFVLLGATASSKSISFYDITATIVGHF